MVRIKVDHCNFGLGDRKCKDECSRQFKNVRDVFCANSETECRCALYC
ncbi:hypothetical protein RDI58_015602 [Solanum bulbocastanum]|uniref:Uncharacterized protein n=1 Tax=Solanum bulbocastanum TaxID=147425 RepID=A0AAN8YC50_SOLBU